MILAIRSTCLTWSALRHWGLTIFFTKDKNKCMLRDYTALCCHKTISQSFSYYHQRKLEWIVKFNCSQSSIGKRPNTSYLNYTICHHRTTLYVSWLSYHIILILFMYVFTVMLCYDIINNISNIMIIQRGQD